MKQPSVFVGFSVFTIQFFFRLKKKAICSALNHWTKYRCHITETSQRGLIIIHRDILSVQKKSAHSLTSLQQNKMAGNEAH